MNVACLYHRHCNDGVAAAAVVKKKYPHAQCAAVNYDDDLMMEVKTFTMAGTDMFIIVDFSLPKEVMEYLLEWKRYQPEGFPQRRIIWCDHHVTAKEKLQEYWDSKEIEGFRMLEQCGAILTWDYLFGTPVPKILTYVNDWDLWKFELGELTKNFHEAAALVLTSPDSKEWQTLLEDDGVFSTTMLRTMVAQGGLLRQAKMQRVELAFKQGWDATLGNYQVRMMNANSDISDLGHYAVQKGYDIGVVYREGTEKIFVSFRSQGEVDVSKIAQSFGGGGHKNAAACSFPRRDFHISYLMGLTTEMK